RWSDYIPKRGRSVHEATALHPAIAQATDHRPRRSRRSSLVLKRARRSARADRRRSRLLAIGLRDLADERSPRHVESAVNRAGQRTGVVLENLDHERRVVGEDHSGLLHTEQARLTLGLAERTRGIDSNVGLIALAERGDRRESGADLERDTGKDQ